MGFSAKVYKPVDLSVGDITNESNTDYKAVEEEVNEETFDGTSKGNVESMTFQSFKEIKKVAETVAKLVPKRKSNNSKAVENLDYSRIEKDGYVVQGYTSNGGYSFISAYDPEKDDSKKRNSLIYVFDKNGKFVCHINTKSKAHLGGISIDESNGILFVTGGGEEGKVYAYDFSQMNFEKGKDFNISDYELKVTFNDEKEVMTHGAGRSSTLYAIDGKLYICNFDVGSKTKVSEIDYDYYKSLSVKEKGRLELKLVENDKGKESYRSQYGGVTATQGIAVYDGKDGEQYFVFSGSSGVANSSLSIYKRDGDKLVRVTTRYAVRPGLEGIYIDKDGDITGIFERDSQSTLYLGNVDKVVKHPENGRWTTHHDALNENMLEFGAWYHNRK